MPVRFQDKRGTATQWRLANPVLADGEFGIESDTGVVKVGNGLDGWNARPPILGSTYLPILGKAADADKLDGLDSTAFLKVTDATATYLPSATAASTYVPQSNTSYNNDINTVVKRDASGNTTLNQLTISQSAPQTASQAARKDYVDAVSTALTNATGSTAASRKLGYYWGSQTAFPTVGVQPGDTCVRSNIGTNGSLWQYTGVVAMGSSGWIPEGPIVCTAATRPTTLFAGLKILETDTLIFWTYDGSTWVPDNPGRINGKMWVTTNAAITNGGYTVCQMGVSRVFGGVTFDVTNQGLKVPYDGIYRVNHHNYLYAGASGSEAMFLATRVRSGVATVDTASAMVTLGAHDQQRSTSDPLVPLKAGDIMQLRVYGYAAGLYYASNSEGNGCALTVEYASPLYGATPL